MTRTFARSLSRKKIMSNDGKLIGTLKNLRVDFDSGQVLDLIVHPDQSFVTDGYTLEDGNLLVVPFEAVKYIKDYIVVDRYLARRQDLYFFVACTKPFPYASSITSDAAIFVAGWALAIVTPLPAHSSI